MPVEFKEQNTVYVANGCNNLPAHKADNQIISCWQLSDSDLKRIADTGVIWFSVMGSNQPPI